MIQHVLSVYDSKAEMFNQPMFFKAKGEAIRAFADEANREGSAVGAHPEDYTLFVIGEFDPESGYISQLKTPISLGLAIEYLKEKENVETFSQNQIKEVS